MPDKNKQTQPMVKIQSKAGCEQQAENFLQKALFLFNVDPLMTRWFIVNTNAGKFYLIDKYPDKEKVKLKRSIKVAKFLVENAPELFSIPPSVELVKCRRQLIF